jgi:protein NUD1
MEHAWLDSLSEDWVSQPASEASPPITKGTDQSKIDNVRGAGSRIPLPKKTAKSSLPGTNENSVNILGERSLNDINIQGSQRGQSKLSQEIKLPERGRYVSRSVSAATNGSVVHNTVQHKSLSASPFKGNGETPEWKRRLVYGEVAYGEQRDLFCSAATGLENMFKPPVPTQEGLSEQSVLNETTLPSSPPPYHQWEEEKDLDESEEATNQDSYERDVSPSPVSRKQPREMRYRMVEADSSDGTVDSYPNRARDDDTENNSSCVRHQISTPSAGSLAPDDDLASRKVSGQSVLRNEDFSPIVLSRHSGADGRVDYAPLEVPADKLRQQLEKLRITQMMMFDSDAVQRLGEEHSNNLGGSYKIETTEDYENIGGFINLKRGGRSADGSFRHRMLSPTLGADTSEMFPEESLQASTPKQFPTVRIEQFEQDSHGPLHSPSFPLAPYPSPEKPTTRSGQESSGSPLKLFGPYDTFTNQTLMRRISQFEEQMSGSSVHALDHSIPEETSAADPNRAFMAPSSPRKLDEAQDLGYPRSRSVSHFGAGDLEGYQFDEEISHKSYGELTEEEEEEEEGDNWNLHANQDDQPPVKMFSLDNSLDQSSSPNSDQLFVRRRRQNTGSSRHDRSLSMGSQVSRGDDTQPMRPMPDVLATPKKRDSGSEGKRPRTSPSKDPTPKRRRTLHKSDIAYGRDDAALVDSVQTTHLHMQSMMGKKRKDARAGDLQQLANPSILAARQILRPRTPTPSQRSSLQREQHPYADVEPPASVGGKKSLKRGSNLASSYSLADTSTEVNRKPSIKTQDFLDEAGKIMAMIRSQVKPPSGLTSVEESEAEHGITSPEVLEDSFQDSTREPFSRPPSRDGKPVQRAPRQQEDPEILARLSKYQELSDMGDIISSSVRSMSLARDALREAREIERKLQDSMRERRSLSLTSDNEVISDPPNIRITENPAMRRQRSNITDGSGREDGEFPSHSSSESTNRTIPTGSSRGSDSRKTIAPQSVSHLIPDQVGSMYLDRQRNIWIKHKERHVGQRNVLPSEDSEDDPFASIPDLSVDMTKELLNLRAQLAQENGVDEARAEITSPGSPAKTPRSQSSRGYVTVSPDAMLSHDMASKAREELSKLETKRMKSEMPNEDGGVEHEIKIHEDRLTDSTPSRRRNLTISFSSPIASIIHDVGAEDLQAMEDDPHDGDESFRNASKSERYQSLTKSAVRNLMSARSRNGSRVTSRQLSVAGRAFIPRPISRIDERDEDASLISANRQVSVIGDTSIANHATPNPRRTSLSFIVTTPGNSALAAVYPDASAIISQNMGNLSLSPLSEFTLHNPDQSYGFEVSYIVDDRHLVTGDGSKRVMSMTVRDLVDRLTEVEPSEPHWEDLRELELREKRLSSLHMLDEFCGRLTSLDASNNSLGHLDGIPTTVRHLKITHNILTELTSWDRLMNLQYIDVSNNELTSLSGLKNLVHLRSIKADNNLLSSLDGLGGHDGLLTLRARGNLIEHVDFANMHLSRLSELDLSGNKIITLKGIGKLSSMVTLKLQGNQLEDFSLGLKKGLTTPLRHLDISDNDLLSLDISQMPGLHVLHADRNCISKLTGFARARYLDSLSLREQRCGGLLDCSFLSSAYEVRKLFLSGNYLGSFNPRVDFLNLQLLELANCGLQELPENMGQLMPNLRSLNLNFNAISHLTPLRFIPRLKKLLAVGNRLADSTAAIEILTEFPHLTLLDLRDNPITLGFYPPLRTVIAPDRTNGVDMFTMPAADDERDAQFSGRLDEATKMRRRLFQVAFVASCKRLKMLDGLAVRRDMTLSRDPVLENLITEGFLPPDIGIQPATQTGVQAVASPEDADDSFS